MKKDGKKFVPFGILLVVILISGFVATISANDSEEVSADIASIPEKISDYVENFVEKKGISSEEINNITEVNFQDLPKEVNIENVDDTNLAIYQIDYNKSEEEQKKLFVITYSVEKLKSQGDLIVSSDKREFLNFGFNEEINESTFLKTSTGITSGLEKGYVMMRDGSITGLSTNLEVLEGKGNIEIILYKNGEKISFGNSFVADSAGIVKDYDTQSKDTISFNAGDVISLYVSSSEGINYKDVISLLEITTN